MKRLSKAQILQMHNLLIAETGGTGGLRDEGLLDSAVNAPFQTFLGNDLYPTIYQKGVRLCYGLIKNHPFIDGNKRIAAMCFLMFFRMNNIWFRYDCDDLCDLILKIAADRADDSDLLKWVYAHLPSEGDNQTPPY